jgi:hypothetical protein
MEDFMIPCMNKSLLGFECFGCGTQRAILLLTEGHFKAAFQMFPAIYTSLLFFIILGLYWLDKKRNYEKAVISLAIINAILIIVAYIYKNFLYLTN